MNRYLSVFIFILLWASTSFAEEKAPGRISGAWIPRNIGPISGGLVYVYNVDFGPPPNRERSRRVPDALAITDNKGRFSLDLPEGAYYLSTRKKTAGDTPGPPQDGDLYGLSRNKNGTTIKYVVESGKTTDIGILRRATVYKSRSSKNTGDKSATSGITAITGRITASDGLPIAGAVVQVYASPENQGKPIYVSKRSGKDGKYLVQVDQEGIYYLIVRSGYGAGRPQTGEMHGTYGGEIAQPVTVRKLIETKGIDIQVGQFIDNKPG